MKKTQEQISRRLFPMRTAKGDRTKMRIVEAAIQSIAEEGIDRLTFESVGKRLGFKPAQVRYHFFEKDDLIAKAIDCVLIQRHESILKKLGRIKNWYEQILCLVNGYFDWCESHPEHGASILLLYYLARVNPKYHALHTRMFDSGSARIVSILSVGQSDHKLSEAEMHSVGLSIWALADGYLLYYLTTKSRKHPRSLRKQCLAAIARTLGKAG